MKKILFQFGAAILAIGAIVVIKMLNLPGVITAVLVIAILIGMMILLAGGMGKNEAGEQENAPTSSASSEKP
jgi:hypothetical protein